MANSLAQTNRNGAIKITLAAIDEKLLHAWQAHCSDCSLVRLHHGSILDLQVDAVVSPANSFGFMDGGIDWAFRHRFGWQTERQLQNQIQHLHHGELLVGCADIVATNDDRIPFLIAAPTMRVPMRLEPTSIHAYLAARAVFLLIQHGLFLTGKQEGHPIHDFVKSVAVPGLGTGVGGMSPDVCARQVRAAIDQVVYSDRPFPATWREAQVKHQSLYSDERRDLQY